MTMLVLIAGSLWITAAVPPGAFDPSEGVAYPRHVTIRGRADPVPIRVPDLRNQPVHASLVKSGPPGPGVEIETDRFVYGASGTSKR